jgi:hypothetical protein
MSATILSADLGLINGVVCRYDAAGKAQSSGAVTIQRQPR